MATSAPTCRSVAAAMPKVSVGAPPTAKGANEPPNAAPATSNGGKGKITRMVPSNLMIELRRSVTPARQWSNARSAVRPPGSGRYWSQADADRPSSCGTSVIVSLRRGATCAEAEKINKPQEPETLKAGSSPCASAGQARLSTRSGSIDLFPARQPPAECSQAHNGREPGPV